MITKKKYTTLEIGQNLIELGLKVQRKEVPLDVVLNEINTDFLNSVSNNTLEWEKDIEPNDRTLALMEIQGLTKPDLTKRLGFSRQYVNELLNGNKPITLKSAKKIATALDVPVSGIIGI